MRVRGKARVGRITKDLVKRLEANDIAVVDHEDIDALAVEALLAARVKCVVNARKSISGRYPHKEPLKLLAAGIIILDDVGEDVFSASLDGEDVEIRDGCLLANPGLRFPGTVMTRELVLQRMNLGRLNFRSEVEHFVQNTIDYAQRELDILLRDIALPPIRPKIRGQQVLIVIRGEGYKDDLATIRPYIEEMRPVLIGVDGGGDALIECGYRPDIILGDMDSVGDKALRCGAQLIVHAYQDGTAPGLERVTILGLQAEVIPAPGTSEDVAMLMAHQLGASLIVAVGAHSSVLDFLKKGRPGMASTLLVRLQVGSILVDAKGVSRLYRQNMKLHHLAGLIGAALLPVGLIFTLSPKIEPLFHLLWMRLQLMLAW